MGKLIYLLISLSWYLAILLTCGCESNSSKAKRLLAEGRYQEVIDRYPELGEAWEARNLIAQQLLIDGNYEEIIDNYVSTDAYNPAYHAWAKELLAEGKFTVVVERYFEGSEYARLARDSIRKRENDSIAAVLYHEARFEELLRNWPDTRCADSVRKGHPEIVAKLQREAKEREKREKEREKREAEVARAQKDRETKEALAKRDICIRNPNTCLEAGMRQWEVRAVLGSPDDKNNTVFTVFGEQHQNEQWIYEVSPYSYQRVYLYFEDFVLTSWQY